MERNFLFLNHFENLLLENYLLLQQEDNIYCKMIGLLNDLFLQYCELFNNFIINTSKMCVNIAGTLRDAFTIEYQHILNILQNTQNNNTHSSSLQNNIQNNTQSNNTQNNIQNTQNTQNNLQNYFIHNFKDLKQTIEQIKKLYSLLKKELLTQFSTEVFPLLIQQDSFKLFLLSKILEASTEPEIEIVTVLKTHDMEEYTKIFTKKKLKYMSQLREFTADDLRNFGIKKLGHVKRLLKLIKNLQQQPKEENKISSC
ncbi:hypothetical protein ABK040_009720 [Willaertia magna]